MKTARPGLSFLSCLVLGDVCVCIADGWERVAKVFDKEIHVCNLLNVVAFERCLELN